MAYRRYTNTRYTKILTIVKLWCRPPPQFLGHSAIITHQQDILGGSAAHRAPLQIYRNILYQRGCFLAPRSYGPVSPAAYVSESLIL